MHHDFCVALGQLLDHPAQGFGPELPRPRKAQKVIGGSQTVVRGNFVEISQGFTGEQARYEAERCLRCDVREHARAPMGVADAATPGKAAGKAPALSAAGADTTTSGRTK